MTGKFEVIRAFYLGDRIVHRGELIDLDDASLIDSCLGAGKIAPADGATAARIRRDNPCTVIPGAPITVSRDQSTSRPGILRR